MHRPVSCWESVQQRGRLNTVFEACTVSSSVVELWEKHRLLRFTLYSENLYLLVQIVKVLLKFVYLFSVVMPRLDSEVCCSLASRSSFAASVCLSTLELAQATYTLWKCPKKKSDIVFETDQMLFSRYQSNFSQSSCLLAALTGPVWAL